MTEDPGAAGRPAGPVGRALHGIARALALLGGLLACAMAAVVTVSVAGRYFISRPVPGDYDIVGILCGCTIFAFLPYCQMVRGNVMVDFFTTRAPPRFRAALDLIGTAIYLAAALMLTWRLIFGMLELSQSGQVIAAFEFHLWWTMPFDIVCMVVLSAVIAYTLTRDLADVRAGRATAHEPVRGD
jgi:TRAP-type C4-dicarboxylate transport system permease small subunit